MDVRHQVLEIILERHNGPPQKKLRGRKEKLLTPEKLALARLILNEVRGERVVFDAPHAISKKLLKIY